jgi:SAM-dependent methyltransferase
MTAFARRARIADSSPDLDEAEQSWWNRHAPLIEEIWGLGDEVCRLARRGYLQDLAMELRRLCRRQPIRVLELACGTGWAGRLLAAPDIAVTGIDFSVGQLEIAKANAGASCTYREGDINDLPELLKSSEFDAVFVHCGLHHLSNAELQRFAAALRGADPGFALALVEPVYHDRCTGPWRLVGSAVRYAYRIFEGWAIPETLLDQARTARVNSMLQEASGRGWFLSPKEMPLSQRDLDTSFDADFEMVAITPVTLFAISFAQRLGLMQDDEMSAALGRRYLPRLAGLDRFLARLGILARLTPDYLFTAIVLRRRTGAATDCGT